MLHIGAGHKTDHVAWDVRRKEGCLRALVVFEDRADSPALRILARRFRHCFCLIGAGQMWIVCDPLKTRIELSPLQGLDELELASHYHASGRVVLQGDVRPALYRPAYRLRPLSCVEVVKRALNVDTPGVFTPYQLYRALLKQRPPFVPFAIGTVAAEIGLDAENL